MKPTPNTAPAIAQQQTVVAAPVADPLAGTAGFLWTFRICVYAGLAVALWLGGPVVRVAALAGMFLALLADRAGAVRHTLHLASLPLLIVLIGVAGLPLGNWMANWLSIPAPLGLLLGCLTVVIAGLSFTGFLGNRATRYLKKHRYLFVLNRVGGSLLGVAEGALLTAVLGWSLSVFGPAVYLHTMALARTQPRAARLLRHVDALRVAFRNDPVGQWLDERNPLPNMPAVMTVAALGELSAEPGLFWRMVEDGDLDELLEIPIVRRHFDNFRADKQIRDAIDKRDLRTLILSHHLTTALNDDELCAAIAEHWPAIRARIATEDMQRAARLANSLDGAARSRYEHALRRAHEFGVEAPFENPPPQQRQPTSQPGGAAFTATPVASP